MHYIYPTQIILIKLLQDCDRTDPSDTSQKQGKLHNGYWLTNLVYTQNKLYAEKLLVPRQVW